MNEAATATAIFPFRQPQERESTIRSRARSRSDQPPPHPATKSPHPPRENTRTTIATEGEAAGTGRPRQARPIHVGPRAEHLDKPQLREEEQTPEQRDRHQQAHRTIPARGTKPRSRDSRTATEHSRSDRNIPARAGFGASADGSIPAHAGREHNEEVDRRSTANTVEHPSNRG